MSDWTNYQCETKIRDILLNSVYNADPEHHLGRPFMSPYQIAIEYDKRYHDDVIAMGYIIGGKGVNTKTSFAQYIGRELSKRIKDGTISDIEGGFFSNQDLDEIRFNHNNNTIVSSATGGDKDLSIFRIKPD